MDLVVYAVPLFILAMVAELYYGLRRGRNTYRLNDAVGSLFLGTLSQARRFVTLGVGGYVYHLVSEYFALAQLDPQHWSTWLFAFVLYDFCYYWLHRLGHERTLLWAAHVAHHQSEEYNLSTALRQTSTGFLLGWLFYLPLFFSGVPAPVVVTVGSLNLIYQFWVHTRHIGKLGWYEWLFVTPSNHRVHHAQNDLYVDRNYGGVFIIWDRLFGTFQEEREEEPCIYGIRGPLHSFNPVKALTHIYVDMARDCWHTASWRDKLRVWVARTGWRPADLAASEPRVKPDLADFRPYDPAAGPGVGAYALFQLVAVVLLLAFMQWTPLAYFPGLALWALMLGTTVTTAFWLQGMPAARAAAWDALRLVLAVPLLLWAGQGTGAGLLPVALAYLAANGAALVLLLRAGMAAARLPLTP
jgi:sterol desaturase/sphingolipid hydroxylase (fatty acid hydroxylase superfamily)